MNAFEHSSILDKGCNFHLVSKCYFFKSCQSVRPWPNILSRSSHFIQFRNASLLILMLSRCKIFCRLSQSVCQLGISRVSLEGKSHDASSELFQTRSFRGLLNGFFLSLSLRLRPLQGRLGYCPRSDWTPLRLHPVARDWDHVPRLHTASLRTEWPAKGGRKTKKFNISPDRTFRNFRSPKSVNRRNFCTSETSIYGFFCERVSRESNIKKFRSTKISPIYGLFWASKFNYVYMRIGILRLKNWGLDKKYFFEIEFHSHPDQTSPQNKASKSGHWRIRTAYIKFA